MAYTHLPIYALCFAVLFTFSRRVWEAFKPLPAGCGTAPKPPSKPWWDIIELSYVFDSLKAAHNGTLHRLEKTTFDQLSDAKGYKVRTCSHRRLGSLVIYTCDSANVNALLASQFSDFVNGGRGKAFAPLLGKYTLIAMDGEAWKHARGVKRPVFQRERMHDLNIIKKHNASMLSTISEARCNGGGVVDLHAMFIERSLKISMELLGLASGDDNGRAFSAAFATSSNMLFKRVALGNLYWLADSVAFRRACQLCHDVVDKHAKPLWLQSRKPSVQSETKHDPTAEQTLMDELIATSKDYAELRSNTYDELRSDILGILLASYETTACLTSWVFCFLARNPVSYARLREQILDHFGTSEEPRQDLTFQSLKSCTYLQYCMKEALRLEPPVPRSIKYAARDVTLPSGGGPDGNLPLFVPKVCHRNVLPFSSYVVTDYTGDDDLVPCPRDAPRCGVLGRRCQRVAARALGDCKAWSSIHALQRRSQVSSL